MRIIASLRFKKAYEKLPSQIQEQVDNKLLLLERNPQHPSLRVKKIVGTVNIWEASITMKYRITFEMSKDLIVLRVIAGHDKALKKP